MRDSDEVKQELFRSCKQKLMEKVVFDSLKAQIMIRTKIIAGKGWEPSNLAFVFVQEISLSQLGPVFVLQYSSKLQGSEVQGGGDEAEVGGA